MKKSKGDHTPLLPPELTEFLLNVLAGTVAALIVEGLKALIG